MFNVLELYWVPVINYVIEVPVFLLRLPAFLVPLIKIQLSTFSTVLRGLYGIHKEIDLILTWNALKWYKKSTGLVFIYSLNNRQI